MIPRGAANDFLLRLPFLFYFPRTRKTSEAAAVWLDEVCRCGAFFRGGPQSRLGEPCGELRLDRNSSRSGVSSGLKSDARAPSLMRNMHCCFAPSLTRRIVRVGR